MLTLAIIKPDAMASGKAGKVLAHLESAGFKVRAARLVSLSGPQAEAFYAVHRAPIFALATKNSVPIPQRCQ